MSRENKKREFPDIWELPGVLFPDKFGLWLPAYRAGVVIRQIFEGNFSVIDIAADTAYPSGGSGFLLLRKIGEIGRAHV